MLSDLVPHIKDKHRRSYHDIGEVPIFKWTLPVSHNQKTMGVFRRGKDYFLYNLLYDLKSEILYFSMFGLGEVAARNTTFYRLTLLDYRTETDFHCNVNKSLADFGLEVEKHKHKVMVPKYVLEQYVNNYKEFKWQVVIIDY